MASRTLKENEALHELVTNVQISDEMISFHISSLPQLFVWQRVPFYNVSAVDRFIFHHCIHNLQINFSSDKNRQSN